MFARRRRFGLLVLLLAAFAAVAFADDSDTPTKADIPYLVHAGSLVETVHFEAKKEDRKKNELTYYVPGTTSTTRTPLAGPEFMMLSEKLDPKALRLYAFEVRNGRREITFNEKKPKQNPVPIILSVFPVSKGLFKVRVDESLERGEYALTPDGTDDVFCFTVY